MSETVTPHDDEWTGRLSEYLDDELSAGDRLALEEHLRGMGVSVEDAMISMQKANISFQTTLQVRNKLVSAYNDIMNMQL